MRLDALREVVRTGGAEQRAQAVASLQGEDAVRLYPALVALLLVESSLRVRTAVDEALRRRPPLEAAERPAPSPNLSERERAALTAALCHERAFLEVMLATPRGRDLLLEVSLEQAPLDEHLLGLCLETDARVIDDILALPLDVSGRSATLLVAFDRLEADARAAVLRALVWHALHAARTVAAEEVERARAAVILWVEGLLRAAGDDGALPTFEAFMEAGGAVGAGPVTARVEPPRPETTAALGGLTACLTLALDPAARRDEAALRAAAASDDAERRALGWRLLLAEGLVTPEEALAASAHAPVGVLVEVLRALPPDLSPGLAGAVCDLLSHRRASVRRAAVDVLARSPLLAAMAAAGLDPRAPGAPLDLLVALPGSLRGAAVARWLEAPRPPEEVARALAVVSPPPVDWAGWPALLGHEAPRVRAAARAALLRAPAHDPAAVVRLLEPAREEDPLAWARALEGLERAGGDPERRLARLLLDPLVRDDVAQVAVRALARRGDARARSALWAFVVGGEAGPWRRFGSRAARADALEALLGLPRPTDAPAVDDAVAERAPHLVADLREPPHVVAARMALRLLRDRDPWQVRLGLRLVEERGDDDEVRAAVTRRLREALARVTGSRRWRRLRAGAARLLRRFLPRAWVTPGSARGARALLPALLDAGARLGRAGLFADDVRPLLAHPDPALRLAAARLYPTLPGALPVRDLVRQVGSDVAREVLRAAHPLQVEALVLERLARARGGEAGPGDLWGWIAARPLPRFVEPVARFLDDRSTRDGALEALSALHRVPDARDAVERAADAVVARAVGSRDDAALGAAAALVRRLERWAAVARLLHGVTWAQKAARDEVVATLRAAQAQGHVPGRDDLAPLLRHGLWDVRQLALSLLRAGPAADLWPALRAAGPGPGRSLPTDFAKPFLGACEDAWEEAMGLAVERLLEHPSGEVARRALKLLNRREREVSTLALLLRLDELELRQPVLTTFSTWAARFLAVDAGGEAARAERLEALRRELRATIEALATAPRARAQPLMDAALGGEVSFARAAALVAIGRLGLVEREGEVARALDDPDPAVARCAAWAAGALADHAAASPHAPAIDAALARLARARDAEVRATARRALVRRLPLERGALEETLADAAPEVRLEALDAVMDRPEALALVGLEARLGDQDPRVRERVLAALERRMAGGGPAPAPDALRGAFADPQPEVRLAALRLVQAAGGELAQALRVEVGAALADPSVHVSGAAIDALSATAGERAQVPDDPTDPEADDDEADDGEPDDDGPDDDAARAAEPATPEEELPTSYALPEGEEDDEVTSYAADDEDEDAGG